jgi:penicillin-binding protein 2
MFERRLKVLLALIGVAAIVVVARLVQLQVVRATEYDEQAREVTLRPPRALPCIRGRILDRNGTVLASDQPCWNVCVPYGLLAHDAPAMERLAAEYTDDDVDVLRGRVRAMWPAIAAVTGAEPADINERCRRIVGRARRVRAYLARKTGIDKPIREEYLSHPVVTGLSHAAAVQARIDLAAFPWVTVTDGDERAYVTAPSFGHLLGRLDNVGPDAVFAQDLTDELRGVAGLEWLFEDTLRGTQGRIQEDIEGKPIGDPIAPVNGSDVHVTIDAQLQERIYDRLAQAVAANSVCTGGAVVVLDARSREALALVSYPGYAPNPTYSQRKNLEAQRKTLPLAFRAVGMPYPPGSTVKPLVLAAALTERAIAPDHVLICNGYLFPGLEKFRCTGIHGPIAASSAIARSCNIYFYKVGERLGIPRLRPWLEAAGLGSKPGTGLLDETGGRLPPLDDNRAAARNVAVGQGQLEVTPLQAANMMACLATGEFREVTLLANDPRDRPPAPLGVSPSHWRVVREGMYRVVNERGGTAYGRVAPPSGPWIVFGKTGSAQGWQRTLDRVYFVDWPDGRREEFIATDDAELERRLADRGPYEVAGWRSNRKWPEHNSMDTTHAWFIGYVADKEARRRLARTPDHALAIAVVLEYAGAGGRVAGPLASDVIEMALEVWPTPR